MGFYIGFNIHNPFFKGQDHFKEIFSCEKKITKNKFFSVNVDKSKTSDFIEFNFRAYLRGQSHAGIQLDGRIGNLSAYFEFRDARHWNYSKNCWMQDASEWLKEFNDFMGKFNKQPSNFEDVSEYYCDEMTPIETCLKLNPGYELLDKSWFSDFYVVAANGGELAILVLTENAPIININDCVNLDAPLPLEIRRGKKSIPCDGYVPRVCVRS